MRLSDSEQSLTRGYRFVARHFYYDASLSPEENEVCFGQSARLHAHRYRIEVTLRGPVHERTGMLLDLRLLDRIVEEAVLRHVDHRNLNQQVPFFASHQPTCENLARWAWQELHGRFQGCRLVRVRVRESDDLHADCEDPGHEGV